LLTLHEMVMASAVPNPMPAVAAVDPCAMRGTIHRHGTLLQHEGRAAKDTVFARRRNVGPDVGEWMWLMAELLGGLSARVHEGLGVSC
jgi:hypothetical protein